MPSCLVSRKILGTINALHLYSFHFRALFCSLYYLILTIIPHAPWIGIIIFLLQKKNLATKGEHLSRATGSTRDRTWSRAPPVLPLSGADLEPAAPAHVPWDLGQRCLARQSPYPETESWYLAHTAVRMSTYQTLHPLFLSK